MGKGIARVSGTLLSGGSIGDTAVLASVTAQDNPSMRWRDAATALHAVIGFVPAQSGPFVPTYLTAWLDYGDGVKRWQGWIRMARAGQTLYIGAASATNGAEVIDTVHVPTIGSIYPPTEADGSWTLTVAVGTIDSAADIPSGATISIAFTVIAIPAPAATAATGAYVDSITYAPAAGGAFVFGWGHIYATLPLNDPNFWFARFTLQTGAVVGGTFTPGGVHADEVGFADWSTDNDHASSMARVGTTNQVYVRNANQWGVPSDGNTCHRIRLYITSRRGGAAGTTTLQQCWSSGVGISTPGVVDHQDLIVDGSKSNIQATSITGAITAGQIASIAAGQITGTITASQIESVAATTITGSITANQIGSASAASITGSITAAQIGSVNASAISGTITAEQIASITAGQITGSIVATTISGTITASQITGSISADQIGAVNASVITGQLASDQIASVNASAVTGGIAASQIATVNASAITGGIAASQIATVNASAITGTIAAAQIASVNASAIQGTLSAGQIATVNAGAIQGSITADQIGSVAASTITGVIVTAQLADQILDTVSKFSTGIFGTNIVNNGTTIGLGTTDTSNMAPNPDFEYDLKDWSVSAGVSISTAMHYTGTKAVKLDGGDCWVASAALFTCKPGDQFVLQSYVYADTGATGYVNALVRFMDASGAIISDGPAGTAYASGAIGIWQVCQTGISTAPVGAAQMQIYPIWTGGAGGTWYLDNVVLTRAVDQSKIASVAATAITGSIAASQIGSVNASALTGLIIAAQISGITASQITGAITASSLSGSINSSQISGTITASQLAGGITADKISTVYASAIWGSISASQIASVYASAISGSISAGQIGTVYASAISGTLAWNQIGSINANSITVNQITAGQIASVNAGSIQAGTISASISLVSPSITGGSITGSSISINALSQVGGTCNILISPNSTGIKVTNLTYSNNFGQLGDGLLILSSWAGGYTTVSPYSMYMNGTTIINNGQWTGRGVSCPDYALSGYQLITLGGGVVVNGAFAISETGVFVGAGIRTPSYGHVASGFNPYVGGVQYYGASFTFYDQQGNLHTVKGGVLVS